VSVNELNHDRQWFNTLIPPSHESPVACFVCRRFSELSRLIAYCKYKAGSGSSTLLVADRMLLL